MSNDYIGVAPGLCECCFIRRVETVNGVLSTFCTYCEGQCAEDECDVRMGRAGPEPEKP